MTTRVFVDANILFSRTVRDWVFLLRNAAEGRMYTVGGSEDVLAETVAKYRDKIPELPGGVITQLRQHLSRNLDELVEDFTVRNWMLVQDAGDAHVRAAAADGQFDMLLTFDNGLLADSALEKPPSYEPIHPDDFLVLVHDSSKELVDDVLTQQLDYFMKHDGEADLPRKLERAGCPKFAARVRKALQERM